MMPVQRFVTKRVEIEAMLFSGTNFEELNDWTNGLFRRTDPVVNIEQIVARLRESGQDRQA